MQPASSLPAQPSPVPAPPKAVHAMDHMIPTRNQPALLGYYYAIFGLLPIAGLLLSPAAITYGLIGLDRGNRLPRNIGYGHALFAVVAGIIGAIISYGCVVALGVMLAMNYMGNAWPFPPDQQPQEAEIEQLRQRVEKLEQKVNPARGIPGRDLN
ncbi:MAG: hypothetical protein QM703_22410 [Gemmatales bacterium]